MTALPDPLPLSDGEREVLLLLAEGHTAKTIAVAIDRSVGAVNERLREARRKTGVGSSRELARLLAAQENRDKQMGVAGVAATEPALSAPDSEATRRPGRTGVMAMSAVLITAVVAAALGVTGIGTWPGEMQDTNDAVTAEELASDPFMSNTSLPIHPNPRELYARLRNEPADVAWAAAKEAVIRSRYGRVPGIDADPAALRIICAKTLCELAGSLPSDQSALEAAMDGLQSSSIHDDLGAAGLKFVIISFGGQSTEDETLFFAYWERTPGE